MGITVTKKLPNTRSVPHLVGQLKGLERKKILESCQLILKSLMKFDVTTDIKGNQSTKMSFF